MSAPATPHVYGAAIDAQTRCVHWHSPRDVVAIKMHCCQRFYPCRSCHDEDAAAANNHAHAHTVWPRAEWHQQALLCGVCKSIFTIDEYARVYTSAAASACDATTTTTTATSTCCPRCKADWNPGCGKHLHLYFDASTASTSSSSDK